MNRLLKKVNARYYPEKLYYSPSWIILCVNNACNLHCKMCDVGTHVTDSNFYQHMMGAKPINMPLELIERIINEMAIHYPNAKLGYAFTEPSVYPHLLQSLQLAKSKGIYTSLTTNGLLLTKQAEDLCHAGLSELNVSLDGPADVHNYIRGHKQSFERAFEGIQKIISLPNAPKVSVFCAITPWNIGRLKEFADQFRNIGIEQIGFMHTVYITPEMAQVHNTLYADKYYSAPSNVEEINFDEYNLDELWSEYQALLSSSYGFPVSFVPNIESREKLDSYYHTAEPFGSFCYDAFSNIMIKTNGEVIPAHSRCYQLTMGNLNNSSLPEIWNSSAAVGFRKDLIKAGGLMPACNRCCSAH